MQINTPNTSKPNTPRQRKTRRPKRSTSRTYSKGSLARRLPELATLKPSSLEYRIVVDILHLREECRAIQQRASRELCTLSRKVRSLHKALDTVKQKAGVKLHN